MRRLWILPIWILAANGALFAQAPSISAVVDAGSYYAKLAPGTIFVVKGSNLCTSSATANISAAPYSTTALGGASIAFTPVGGGFTIKAFMIYSYISGNVTQLAGELENDTAAGDYNMTVTTSAGTSAPFQFTVVAQKPGLMTIPGSGAGRALVQNVVSATEYDLNGFTSGAVAGATFLRSPAKPSEYLIAWGVGLGAAAGYDTAAPAGGLNLLSQGLDVKAVVNGVEITPAYAGRSNLFPGLDNITFQLPANITTGCFVPLQIKVAGEYSNVTMVAIAPNASATACVDAKYDQAMLARLDNNGSVTVGSLNLTSVANTLAQGGQALNSLKEAAGGYFGKYTADTILDAESMPSLSGATLGACQVNRNTFTIDNSISGGVGNPVTLLDAGVITLNGPNVSNTALIKNQGSYYVTVGNPGGAGVIGAGTYTLTGSGGADVGPFTASITIPQPLRVTGGMPTNVNRTQDLTLSWTGGGTSTVAINGVSEVTTSTTSTISTFDRGSFTCYTTADKGTFTIPTAILSQLPATPTGAVTAAALGSLGVTIGTIPTSGNGLFSAPLEAGGNTDSGFFTALTGSESALTYQ